MVFPRLLVVLLWLFGGIAFAGTADAPWYAQAEDGTVRVPIYFFWSQRCPHCQKARPFVESLPKEHPWIELHSHELASSRDNVSLYVRMAEALGQEARSVPAFFVCGRMLTGYDGPEGMGREILSLAELCRRLAPEPDQASGQGKDGPLPSPASPAQGAGSLRLPVLGLVDPHALSLPMFTLVVAGLDAFNPCAFFVLLFLLSLMVHARSRSRMLLIGGTFVFFSGLVYFVFMAAWLNLFLVVGGAPLVTLIAGAIAVLIGLLNTKDYFYFKQGPSLTIPDGAKPALYRRMRGLLGAENMAAMLVGTVALALAANSYELLCTAGFPMIFTRVLTLHEVGGAGYYGYLALYNLIYILPLLAIVAVFTVTLGVRKLSEQQGRVLKLLSGIMMLGLGVVLLAAPDLLNSLWVGVALLSAALTITVAVDSVRRLLDGRAAGRSL